MADIGLSRAKYARSAVGASGRPALCLPSALELSVAAHFASVFACLPASQAAPSPRSLRMPADRAQRLLGVCVRSMCHPRAACARSSPFFFYVEKQANGGTWRSSCFCGRAWPPILVDRPRPERGAGVPCGARGSLADIRSTYSVLRPDGILRSTPSSVLLHICNPFGSLSLGLLSGRRERRGRGRVGIEDR